MQQFKRAFRMWDFRVSHDQLLLRSPKSESTSKNIDVVFVGVDYMSLPTKMRDLKLEDPSDEDHERAQQTLGRSLPRENVFVIASAGRRHIVVAAAMKVFENELDMFESSLERF